MGDNGFLPGLGSMTIADCFQLLGKYSRHAHPLKMQRWRMTRLLQCLRALLDMKSEPGALLFLN